MREFHVTTNSRAWSDLSNISRSKRCITTQPPLHSSPGTLWWPSVFEGAEIWSHFYVLVFCANRGIFYIHVTVTKTTVIQCRNWDFMSPVSLCRHKCVLAWFLSRKCSCLRWRREASAVYIFECPLIKYLQMGVSVNQRRAGRIKGCTPTWQTHWFGFMKISLAVSSR